ncbi:MAG: hypothetical protein U5K37_06380 [Natrialbaceae archaeon]|nr:hypothetical protein [Natrialbaceae archaeon]
MDLELTRERLPLPESDVLDDETLANSLVTAKVVADWLAGDDLEVSFSQWNITNSRTPSDVSERAAPMFARGIKTLTEILDEAEDPLADEFSDHLEQLEYQVRYGLDADCAAFAIHHIATERRWIDHMRDRLGIEHPREIATGPVFSLFGDMPNPQASNSPAGLSTSSARNQRCHAEIHFRCPERGADTGAIRSLFEATQTASENYCEERLNNCNGVQYRSFDERGQIVTRG